MATSNNGLHSTQRLLISAAVSAASGLTIALIVFYVGFGYNAVSKNDLEGAVNRYSPYAQDRATIRLELDNLEARTAQLAQHFQDTHSELAAIKTELEVLTADVDRLLNLHTKP